MNKDPDGEAARRRDNVVPLRSGIGASKQDDALSTAGIEERREPTGDDVITMLLSCAPGGVLRALDLGRNTSSEWASLVETDRTTLEQKLWLHVSGKPSSRADQVQAVRARRHYASVAGLALAYAFLKPAWRKANPQARDVLSRAAVPYDVLMQFGESLRCEIEDREAGLIEDQDRHYRAVVVALKADRDAARAERDALQAAETQGKRKRSDDAKKGARARFAEDGVRGKPADKARAKYLPMMKDWLRDHPTPHIARNACARHFHPMIEAEYGSSAPARETVRSWLQGWSIEGGA